MKRVLSGHVDAMAMDAVVLAGGYATRLWPITKHRPKMLLPVGGSTVIDRIFAELEADDRIDDVYVSTNERFAPDFEAHLADAPYEKPSLSVEDTTTEDEKFGVIGALAQLVAREGIDDDLLVIAGDNLISFDVGDFLDFFEEGGSPCIAAYDVGSYDRAQSYGVVDVEDGRVVDFQEKPDRPKSTLVSIACYGFPAGTLPLLSDYLDDDNNPDEPGWFVQWLYPREPVAAFTFDGAWFDIGTPESYLDAVAWTLDGENLIAEDAVLADTTLGENVHVMSGAEVTASHLNTSIVFPDATIEDCGRRSSTRTPTSKGSTSRRRSSAPTPRSRTAGSRTTDRRDARSPADRLGADSFDGGDHYLWVAAGMGTMSRVMTIGGARFMGRYTVEAFLDRGDDVTLFTRGRTDIPFDPAAITHFQGDRRNRDDLEAARDDVDPDVVVDFAAYDPADVRTAVEVFADVDAYVFISSTHAYQRTATIPLREGVTPLEPYADGDDAYGPSKAEGDRIVFEAAADGVNATSVRPTAIYGPYDPTERQDYWISRVNRYDRIVLPGDEYRMPIHLGYVEDVARAIRLVVEDGEPGEAYNVATREHLTYDDFVRRIADALDTEIEVVHATDRDLAPFDLSVEDFSLCEPYPYLVSTEKLARMGWEATSFDEGIPRAVEEHLESDRDGSAFDPDRDVEEAIIEALADESRPP